MISGLSPSNDQFLASLNILQNNLSQADEELSSGLRVNQASDAPQSLQDIFETRSELGQANQAAQNLTTIQGQVQTAGGALQSAIELLNQAVSLGTARRQHQHFAVYAAESGRSRFNPSSRSWSPSATPK